MLKNHVFGSFNLNKYRLSFEDIFLGTLDTYTKKNEPPSIVFFGGGGSVHGKVCWLIAYIVIVNIVIITITHNVLSFLRSFMRVHYVNTQCEPYLFATVLLLCNNVCSTKSQTDDSKNS